MAKKKETQKPPDGLLITAAKTIGAAAGTIAAAGHMTAPQKPKVPKLVNKNKSRLPRRQKKTAQKVATMAKRAANIKSVG